MTLDEIADQMEKIADRGYESDREGDHSEADGLLIEALRAASRDHADAYDIERIVREWKRGAQFWWWA